MVRLAASASDSPGLGLLTWVYPPGLMDRVVAACGRSGQRQRLLPLRLVMYFVWGPALFSPAPYREVMRHLVEGPRSVGLLGNWRVPAKFSLLRALQRLGSESLRWSSATAGRTAAALATQSRPSHTCTTSPRPRDQNSHGCRPTCKDTTFCTTIQPVPDVDARTSCARASCVWTDRASLDVDPVRVSETMSPAAVMATVTVA
ncbi:transposase domain-containing protein [Streptomyces sp. NPDC046984]|uniref:transposase domain-containing protein n=1 Tax=Streptomyces sp. NPDC046984 TaxID=3155138 RepID=UPI0033F3E456